MRNCPQCNNTVVDDKFSFCPSCGYDLRKITGIRDSAENNDVSNKDRHKGKVVVCDVCGEETTTGSGACLSCGALLTGNEKPADVSADNIAEDAPKVNLEQKKITAQPSQQKKDKPVVQQSAKQQKHKPAAVPAPAAKQGISPVQIAILVIGLIAAGLLILQISGVFDAAPAVDEHAGHNHEQQGGTNTGVSLDQINAINAMESEVLKDTTNSERVLQLAHMLNDSGFDERAIRYYRMYIKSNPGNADAIVDMGVCYFKLKDYITAKAVMRQGLKVNPQHQIAHFNLGIINLSAGSVDSAKIWWQKTIELGPETEIGNKAKQLLNSH